MERLVGKGDWNRDAHDFVNKLRNPNDPPPKFISPPIPYEGARARNCLANVAKYCAQYAGCEAVKGFKLWVLPTYGLGPSVRETPYVAMVHMVARNRETGKYIDVTPAEAGDEGQKMLFVPSSRVYPDWSVEEIADYAVKGFEPRMGSVCNGQALKFKQATESEQLHKGCPDELALLFCPKLATVKTHLAPLAMNQVMDLLTKIGAQIVEADAVEYAMVDATKFRSVHRLVLATIKEAAAYI